MKIALFRNARLYSTLLLIGVIPKVLRDLINDVLGDFDIVCTGGPEGHPRLLWEVEVKYSWKTDEWPDSWKELRIPYRKQRLLDKWKSECYNDILTFVVFNHDCTKSWHVDGHTLLDCEVKEVSNRNIRKGEKFFHIPVTDAYLVDMKNESSGGH